MYYIGAPKPRGPSIFVLRHQARQCASSKRKGGEALIRGAPNRRQDLGAANVWSKISWTPILRSAVVQDILDHHGPRNHRKLYIYMVS